MDFLQRMEALRERVQRLLGFYGYLIITVPSFKGGVGKTTLAQELSWWLDAIYVDLDWNDGNGTVSWGYLHHNRMRAPLLDAIELGRPPILVPGATHRRCDMVPGHPDFEMHQPSRDVMAKLLIEWGIHWGRALVVDTHPGDGDAAFGSVMAAHVNLVPAPLETKPLNALDQLLRDLVSFDLMVVPSSVPRVAPGAEVRRLAQMTERAGKLVASPISAHPWLRTRKHKFPVSAQLSIPAKHEQYVDEVGTVAEEAISFVERAAAA